MLYADHASTSFPILFPPKELGGNPSNGHAVGRRAKDALEEARASLQRTLNAPKGSSLVFTSGGTEANNLVLQGCAWDYIITARTEHAAVHLTAEYLANHRSVEVMYLTLDGAGTVFDFRTRLRQGWGPSESRSFWS